jgi:hypothetical protein
MRWVPVLLAVAWLVPSVMVGLHLIQDTPPASVSLSATPPNLTASSELNSYGGDAYTGIQNAAAYTEKAVVDGVNGLATFQLDLQKELAAQDASRAADSQAHIEDGLGFLIIGVAVVYFTLAITRLSRNTLV